MKTKKFFFFSIVMVSLFGLFCSVQIRTRNYPLLYANNNTSDLEQILSEIQSNNNINHQNAIKKFSDNRKKFIKQLLRYAENNKDKPHPKHRYKVNTVIKLLGNLRSKKAIPFLIKNIDLKIPYVGSKVPQIFNYPCAIALSKIGKNVTNRILKDLRNKENLTREKARFYSGVLILIEGKKAAMFLLENHLKKARNEPEKGNFKVVIRELEKIEEGFIGTEK